MTRAVVGIGANLGDRLATMREAVAAMERIEGLHVLARSRVYETAPVGLVEQPWFFNAAVSVEYMGEPVALLDALLGIERELGRHRGVGEVRWGPRSIDLDLLWIEGLATREPRLVVPHPRLHERAFALIPMLEVAPGAVDPRSGAAFVVPEQDDVRATAFSL